MEGFQLTVGTDAKSIPDVDPARAESLAYLTEQTGGFAIVNTNDLAKGLDRIDPERTAIDPRRTP